MNIQVVWQDLYNESIAYVGNYRLKTMKPANTENVYWSFVDLIWPNNCITSISKEYDYCNTLINAKQDAERNLTIALHKKAMFNE